MTCVELRRATPADRGALIEMYRGFEPKGAALGLPPRKEIEKRLSPHRPHSSTGTLQLPATTVAHT